MHLLVKNMAFFLRCKQAGLQDNLELPEREPLCLLTLLDDIME
ncbi:hypothetical protein [Anaerocolumna xylanovorans]|uniref:Uncharacterized protein n=1 Tax=Anaerocolumna xylanovorans DSM 12503 TaxID=1121345 RepID=A0A1M7Y0X7_9FIRM|nr:hypothetical protein [Anaerocolumna xylanovorans]SHO45370.1 hypothetical protein SAMN02745217_00939 [Anaerocolumna xylanovorans DSM 12503]